MPHTQHTYIHTLALAANYYWHSRRRSYLVIAHGIAMRMRNRRGLFREHALFAEPKVAFCPRLCDDAAAADVATRSGVRSYNPARCKKGENVFSEGTETRAPRVTQSWVERRPTVVFYQTPSGFRMIGLVAPFVLSLSGLWDDTIADFATYFAGYISIILLRKLVISNLFNFLFILRDYLQVSFFYHSLYFIHNAA